MLCKFVGSIYLHLILELQELNLRPKSRDVNGLIEQDSCIMREKINYFSITHLQNKFNFNKKVIIIVVTLISVALTFLDIETLILSLFLSLIYH